MHIKEVILDGFKSYARRTVISGFDSQFNAITGLNGSGKSNILDAICFVLGISNLSKVRRPPPAARAPLRRAHRAQPALCTRFHRLQVRVTSMRQLIYKGGDAGITKASVSVVFDNSDKAGSPVGYDQHDSITVTRQVRAARPTPPLSRGGRFPFDSPLRPLPACPPARSPRTAAPSTWSTGARPSRSR